MQILTAAQIRELDRFTIEHAPISSIGLMERAADACINSLLSWYPGRSFTLVCGQGNNGGDGLAIAYRLLKLGIPADIHVVQHTDRPSTDFLTNLERLTGVGAEVRYISNADSIAETNPESVVVDAMLGTGLTRPLSGLLADVAATVNALPNATVSIDLPTGLFADDNTENSLSRVVRADRTLTFHCPKLAFMFAETAEYVGEWEVLDIGLMEETSEVQSSLQFVTAEAAAHRMPPRPKFSHKGIFGHALLMAGSRGKLGAAVLAAKGCLRAGAGLLTVAVPGCGPGVIHVAVPEAMCIADADGDVLTEYPKHHWWSAIGMGPGIGTDDQTAKLLKQVIQDAGCPLVLDADALNLLADNPTWMRFLPRGTVLTPHPGEFDRLAGKSSSGHERWQKQLALAQKLGCTIVLKGAHSSICTPSGQTFFNSTGNPGMASAGSGDVLTGIILGLMTQGMTPPLAAVLGVFAHGLSADIAVRRHGMAALMAGDIADGLGRAFRKLGKVRGQLRG